jgi:uncharacterized protein
VAKLLLAVAVFAAVYLILRSYRRKIDKSAPPPAPGHPHGASRHGEDMVRCRVCGVHLPRSEAIASRGEIYCSREHLQLSDRERKGG